MRFSAASFFGSNASVPGAEKFSCAKAQPGMTNSSAAKKTAFMQMILHRPDLKDYF